MKILIKITKEMYQRAMFCGYNSTTHLKTSNDCISSNCAIALAVREVAPKAFVGSEIIYWNYRMKVDLPLEVVEMVKLFDSSKPFDRLNLPEFSFEIDFPDQLVEQIGIQQVYKILGESKTLEYINS